MQSRRLRSIPSEKSRWSDEQGFGFIETLTSVGVLTAVSVGVAQLFAVAALTNHNDAARTSTAVLAVDKMEQFRALTWGFESLLDDELGLPVSDRRPTSASFLRPPASQASSRPRTARWKRTFHSMWTFWTRTATGWAPVAHRPSQRPPAGPGQSSRH